MTRRSAKSDHKSDPVEPGSLVVQPNGRGAIRHGSKKGNTPGTGRPRDKVRAKLLKIAQGKGLPFLRNLFDGEVPVAFVGTCPECKKQVREGFEPFYWQQLQERVDTSIEHRLKASDQTLRYGLGTQVETLSREVVDQEKQHLIETFHAAVSAVVDDATGRAIAAAFSRLYTVPNGG